MIHANFDLWIYTPTIESIDAREVGEYNGETPSDVCAGCEWDGVSDLGGIDHCIHMEGSGEFDEDEGDLEAELGFDTAREAVDLRFEKRTFEKSFGNFIPRLSCDETTTSGDVPATTTEPSTGASANNCPDGYTRTDQTPADQNTISICYTGDELSTDGSNVLKAQR